MTHWQVRFWTLQREDYTEDPVAEADIGELDRDEPVSDDEFSDFEGPQQIQINKNAQIQQ